MSRRLRYQVAVSLDGFIAGPRGEADWIVMDPSIDFGALFAEFDTLVMGRKTYEVMADQGAPGMPGAEVIVFSRTLSAVTRPGFRIVSDDPRAVVATLKATPGRDIWLFGGGSLFRTLLDVGLVDTVELAVMPVLLGSGVPLLPEGASARLVLADQKVLPESGIVMLSYSVHGSSEPPARVRYVKATRSKPRRPKPTPTSKTKQSIRRKPSRQSRSTSSKRGGKRKKPRGAT
jgi:dihydrofolate reductase